ncbi:hypothetical protein U1701_17590 [Sphingomonas sp. PB2P19]|uniref:hypothetical protein n=1 Tax=Sphingomonas rhamnosi TaxID=3096156 RepID=UPI002FC71008
MTMINLTRRMEKLETEAPGQGPMVRVLFKRNGDPDPVADPPLLPSERAIVVNFVPPLSTSR